MKSKDTEATGFSALRQIVQVNGKYFNVDWRLLLHYIHKQSQLASF